MELEAGQFFEQKKKRKLKIWNKKYGLVVTPSQGDVPSCIKCSKGGGGAVKKRPNPSDATAVPGRDPKIGLCS